MRVRVPGDKSISQRALILAALAEGESRIRGLLTGGDTLSTARALRALGAGVPDPSADIRVTGVGLQGLRTPARPLDVGNSGTGARLLMGVLAGQRIEATLTGDASLRSRPMKRVTEPLGAMGARFEMLDADGRLPVRVHGAHPLRPLTWETPVASAQVKSALLLAGVTGRAFTLVSEPRRSRDHTERMLGIVGAPVIAHEAGGRWQVELRDPPERIEPLDLVVPGDLSSAAFLLVLAALGGAGEGLEVEGVGLNPTRCAVLDVLRRAGVDLHVSGGTEDPRREPVGTVGVAPSALRAFEIGGEDVPGLIDEIPVLAVLAARAEGVSRITGAGELRHKESDRIAALVGNLRALGVEAEELPDGLEVQGTDAPLSGRVHTHGDHRIAMAFAVLGATRDAEIHVDEPEAAAVSFPGFWSILDHVRPSGVRPVARGRDFVVTIDGPAGSGKSTTAREVARRLGFRHLDSGALYRALTYALLEAGREPDTWDSLTETDFRELGVRVEAAPGRLDVSLGDRPLGDELRSESVTSHVSHLARLPAARSCLLDLQRDAGRLGGLVADGRDMGTVVFPRAALKIFLVADLRERARRRLLERRGVEPTPARIVAEAAVIATRDRRDACRIYSPLTKAADAIELDTTDLAFEEQVSAVMELAYRLTHS